MKRCLLCSAILLGAAATCIAPARANVIVDHFHPDSTFSPTNNVVAASATNLSGNFVGVRAAAKFTVTGSDYHLLSVTLPLSYQKNAAGLLRIRLTEDAGNAPGNTVEVLADSILPRPFANPFTGTIVLRSSGHPYLVNGASYWIVTELNRMPTLSTEQFVDFRWFDNTTHVATTFRQQQTSGSLPTDPWSGVVSSANGVRSGATTTTASCRRSTASSATT